MKKSTAARPTSPAAARRRDKWIVIGPGGGGGQFNPTVSPHDTNLVFARCDMTGAYVSHDGGESWRMFNLRAVVHRFVFDPVDPDTAYACAGGIWRTTDRGDSWKLVYPDPKNVSGIIMKDDHAGWIWDTESDAGVVRALAVDPADSKTLYAVMQIGGKASLRLSTDWGRTWSDLAEASAQKERFVRLTTEIYVDPKSPKGDRTIYLSMTTMSSCARGARGRATRLPRASRSSSTRQRAGRKRADVP